MARFMPKTATTQQIQKQYRALFDEVIQKKEPLVIMNKNAPQVVIIDMQTFENLLESKQKYEEAMAMKAIKSYEKDKAAGKLIKANSLKDLINENKAN